jgi:hypothetical protein
MPQPTVPYEVVFMVYAVAQLIEALHYKLEGRSFDYAYGFQLYAVRSFYDRL